MLKSTLIMLTAVLLLSFQALAEKDDDRTKGFSFLNKDG